MADLNDVTKTGFFNKYRSMLQNSFDCMAEYEERASIFERTDIPRNHFYNVINEFRANPGKKEHPYHIPLEFIEKTIIAMSDKCPQKYKMVQEICNDVGCTCLTPQDKEELKAVLKDSAPDPLKVLALLQKIVGDE